MFARVGNRFLDQIIQLVGRKIGEPGPCVGQGQVKQAPFDAFLNEPRKSTLPHPTLREVCSNRDIRSRRDTHGPARCIIHVYALLIVVRVAAGLDL